MPDVFNNPSRDYVDPGLAPCVGASDSYKFEFLPKEEVGVTSGSEVKISMDISDVENNITEWQHKTHQIASGEVIYIPGLTKGIDNRRQVFTYYNDVSIVANQEYFMEVDLSINYYYNFRYNTDASIDASSNYATNVDIDDALNVALGAKNITITASYDPSNFTFTGDTEGYDFTITKAQLTLIDASLDSSSPFDASIVGGVRQDQSFAMTELTNSRILASKYPNGAMLGIIMKAIYPSTADCTDQWIYTKNVKSPFTFYDQIGDTSVANLTTKDVDVGMNGAGNSTTMSAAEYLDYVNTKDLWNKVGNFFGWIGAEDTDDSAVKNQVGGMYVFNPQTFPVQIEYMAIE